MNFALFLFKRINPVLVLVLAGCSGLLLRPDMADPSAQLPPGVVVSAGRLTSSTGCGLDYRVYQPESDAPPGRTSSRRDQGNGWVILGHGFLRSQQRMRDLAAAMAAQGMCVATLDFCNQKPWAGRHVQNSRDMVALARHLGAAPVVYAGFSAGGLAALLAARADPSALGVLTLDLVETQGLGVNAARGLDKPLLALTGEPTNCNALANGQAVYRATDQAWVRRIPGAGHCDFESPTDGLCELVCADPDGPDSVHRERIIASAVGAVQTLLEGDTGDWPATAASAPERRGPQPGSAHLREP
jgi:hypothetical protein